MTSTPQRTAVLILLIATVSASTTRATLGPSRDLAELTREADVIVIGAVTDVVEVGETWVNRSARRVAARLNHAQVVVYRILKGRVQTDAIPLEFTIPDEFIGYPGIESHVCRLFFLTLTGDHYEFVSPFYPSVVAVPMERMTADGDYDRVIEALVAVLSVDASEPRRREAIDTLGFEFNPFRKTSPSHVVTNALRQVLNDRDASLRLRAVGALLNMNDIIALPMAEEILLGSDPDRTEPAASLRFGIAYGLKDKAAIPALARLLDAAEPETRRAASLALGHTLSMSAIEHLARALGDVDFEVRLSAVRGLAEISGQTETGWYPGAEGLRNNEDRYMRYWRNWLAQLRIRC